MIVLGIDTATSATAVALAGAGEGSERRDDPPAGEHPGHATRLLAMAQELLAATGVAWEALERIAVGTGPGTFTGLRVGIATARGLAQALSIPLAGVSSLAALAQEALAGADAGVPGARIPERGAPVLAVIDARRGEVFAAAYTSTTAAEPRTLAPARALAPDRIAELLAEADAAREASGGWVAVGDGAVRYRDHLRDAGVEIPADASDLHRVHALAVCRAGGRGATVAGVQDVVPDYRRRPDAELALGSAVAQQRARR